MRLCRPNAAGSYAGTSATHLDTGLLDGTTYYYYVVAVNSQDRESGRSNEVAAKTLTRPTTGPGPGAQTDITPIIIGVVIILVVVSTIIALLLVKRRKKRGELEGQEETAGVTSKQDKKKD